MLNPITDYSAPFYAEGAESCFDCTATKCKATQGCAAARRKFIEAIEAANGKAVMIDDRSAYTLDNGRLVYIGAAFYETGKSRNGADRSSHAAEGWYVDTGERVTIVSDFTYFAAGKNRASATWYMKDEKNLNPRKAITLAANI